MPTPKATKLSGHRQPDKPAPYTPHSGSDQWSISMTIKARWTVEPATHGKKKPFRREIAMEQEAKKRGRGSGVEGECVAWISGGRIIASSIMAFVRSLLLIKTY